MGAVAAGSHRQGAPLLPGSGLSNADYTCLTRFAASGRCDYAGRGGAARFCSRQAASQPPSRRVARDQDALALLVSFERDRFTGLARQAPAPRLLRSALLDDLRRELRRELTGEDAGSALALEGLALLLLSRTGRLLGGGEGGAAAAPRREPGAPEWLGDALRLVEQCYSQPISLAVVAARLAIHPATLAAACQRFAHRSIGELIRDLRLRHAWHALMGTRAPIKQIAVEAGFYDQAHLGRWFKRRFGLSPAEARRRGAAL
jgi:AraC-like DNA-binding protein